MSKAAVEGYELTLEQLAEMDLMFRTPGFALLAKLLENRMNNEHIPVLKDTSAELNTIRCAQAGIEEIELISEIHEQVLTGIEQINQEAKEESEEE